MGTRMRIGVAVGANALTGSLRGSAGTHSATVPVTLSGTGDEAALEAAFARLRAELDAAAGASSAGAVAHIALLPPLADVRLVQLPPLRPAEALAVLRRDAGRYFVGVAAPRVIGVRTGKAGAPAFTAAAAEPLVNALRSAAAAAGWRVGAVAPAAAAWLTESGARPEPRAVIAVVDGTAHLMGISNGAVTALRRVSAADPQQVAAAAAELHGAPGGNVAIFAGGAERDGIARALTAAGWSPSGLQATAAGAAAHHAHAADLPLVSTAFAIEQGAQEARVARRLVLAAAVLVAAAGVVELWGARRELDAVRMRRSEIRATVEPLLALRDSVEQLGNRAGDIDSIARAIPRWTGALFDLAMLLPPESHVTRLHATGDTLVIDAEGARAGAALEALRTAGTLRDVRLLGAVDRQLTDGATTSERFRIRARLAAPSAAPAQDGGAP